MKRFILCGDSWAWGYEVLPTNIHSNDSERLGYEVHFLPECVDYRVTNRYGNIVANSMGMEVVDLSECGISNTTIIRKLINYLTINGYFSTNVETPETFISIGWSSPARIEVYCVEHDRHYSCNNMDSAVRQIQEGNPLGTLLEQYFIHASHPIDYLNSWTTEVFKLYKLLDMYNIPFVMHQAFYHIDNLKDGSKVYPLGEGDERSMAAAWRDKLFWDDYEDVLSEESRILWESIDKKHFMLKDSHRISTMNEYIIQNEVEKIKALGLTHPNAVGHRIWADYMISHINKYFTIN